MKHYAMVTMVFNCYTHTCATKLWEVSLPLLIWCLRWFIYLFGLHVIWKQISMEKRILVKRPRTILSLLFQTVGHTYSHYIIKEQGKAYWALDIPSVLPYYNLYLHNYVIISYFYLTSKMFQVTCNLLLALKLQQYIIDVYIFHITFASGATLFSFGAKPLYHLWTDIWNLIKHSKWDDKNHTAYHCLNQKYLSIMRSSYYFEAYVEVRIVICIKITQC